MTSPKSLIFVYQTKNLLNCKTYVGVRKTNNINDGYIGFGIRSQADAERICRKGTNSPFPRAVNKYGYSNFKREILSFFDTYDEALEEERAIVDSEWVKRNDNYNISVGGASPVLTGGAERKRVKNLSKSLRRSNSKKWVVLSEDGGILRVSNLHEFIRQNGYTRALGKSKSFFNGVWACKEDEYNRGTRPSERVLDHTMAWSVTHPSGLITNTSNLRLFCLENGMSESAVYTAVYNSRPYQGYMFEKVKSQAQTSIDNEEQ